MSYLQQPVSCLKAAILDGGSPRENVLDIDWRRAPNGNITRRYAEAKTFRTFAAKKEIKKKTDKKTKFNNGMWCNPQESL